MLTYDSGGDELLWTWDGGSLDHWLLEQSSDGVTGWSNYDELPPSRMNELTPDSNEYYRVSARDVGGNIVGDYSNVVFVAP